MGDMADYYQDRDEGLIEDGLVPCDWCDRETQETCPACAGSGYIDRAESEGK